MRHCIKRVTHVRLVELFRWEVELTRRWRWTCRAGSTSRRGTPSCRRDPSLRSWRTSRRRRRRRWDDRSLPGCDIGPSSRSRRRTADTCPASDSWEGSRPCWSVQTTLTRATVKEITIAPGDYIPYDTRYGTIHDLRWETGRQAASYIWHVN